MNSAEIIKEQIDILRNMQNEISNETWKGCQLKIELTREIVALVLTLNVLQCDNDYSEITQNNNKSYAEFEQSFKESKERIEKKMAEFKNPWS